MTTLAFIIFLNATGSFKVLENRRIREWVRAKHLNDFQFINIQFIDLKSTYALCDRSVYLFVILFNEAIFSMKTSRLRTWNYRRGEKSVPLHWFKGKERVGSVARLKITCLKPHISSIFVGGDDVKEEIDRGFEVQGRWF